MENSQANIGLARSAPSQPVEPQIATNTPPQASPSVVWDGVPLDIYAYFHCDWHDASDKHKSEMKEIYDYAVKKSNGKPGDVIQKIEELQVRLGEPRIGETRISQLYNWVRIRNLMADAHKQMSALERGLNQWH